MKLSKKQLTCLLTLTIAVLVLFPKCNKKPGKPNVILLITIDTLRRDHLGFYGYPRNTSPFIDQLAKNGVVFKNTITPLPLTDGSHASILTALHPLVHGVQHNATKLTKKVETITEVLKKNGFYTIGTVSVSHLSRNYNFSQGFDTFSDRWKKNNKYNSNWQRIAETTNQSLFRQIKGYKAKHSQKPLFIWVHYYDPHTPYINRKEITFKTPMKYAYPKIEHYDKEIRYTDNAVKELLGFMKKEGLAEKMTVCITSDHGEQLGEHGVFGDHQDIYSETVFVPLLFTGYSIPEDKIVNEYVSTMDIAPTLLKLVDLKFPAPVHGLNLLDNYRAPKKKPASGRWNLVIGDPRLTRSIQWIQKPFSYIMNFDFPHQKWFVSMKSTFPEEKLEPVKKQSLELKYFKKSDKYGIFFDYPQTNRNGLYVGILRFDIKQNKGLVVSYKIGSNQKSRFIIKSDNPGTFSTFFPVTPLDRLSSQIHLKKGTEIENFRYALLPVKEVAQYLEQEIIHPGNKIFQTLKSPRKNRNGHELYNLDNDFPMLDNLLKRNSSTLPQAVEGKKQIYTWLEKFRKESKRINGKSIRRKPLSEKEKEMLKSLGYL